MSNATAQTYNVSSSSKQLLLAGNYSLTDLIDLLKGDNRRGHKNNLTIDQIIAKLNAGSTVTTFFNNATMTIKAN